MARKEEDGENLNNEPKEVEGEEGELARRWPVAMRCGALARKDDKKQRRGKEKKKNRQRERDRLNASGGGGCGTWWWEYLSGGT